MTIWFTSDLHFSHANIISYTNRPYASVEEMNQALVDNYNSLVSDEDTVYFVGDVCMGKIAETLPIVGELKGHKRLILGNHDRPFPTHKKSDKWFDEYAKYFEDIRLTDTLEIAGRHVELNHFPFIINERDEGRYNIEKLLRFYPEDKGQWLIHGHVHLKDKMTGPRAIHVGIDAWDCHPVHISQIQDLINGSLR